MSNQEEGARMDNRLAENLTRFENLSDDELKDVIKKTDHRIDKRNNVPGLANSHIYWDCPACDMEAVIAHRERSQRAQMPGGLQPMDTSAIRRWIKAKEISTGVIAAHATKPGSDERQHVECTDAEKSGDVMITRWKVTNSDFPDFKVVYGLDEILCVIERAG